MKVLAIDTSSKFLSIALHNGSSCLIEESHLLDRKHSDELIPRIKAMLDRSSISIKDIDVFVVGLGPGSFTGLRIGVSCVKGFGIALKKRCIGIASIDALALGVDSKDLIVPIIDAKRGNVYSAIYKKKGDQVIRLSGYQLVKIDKLLSKIKNQTVFIGDGLLLYGDRIVKLNKKVVFLEELYWYPRASNLVRLAVPRIKKSKRLDLAKLKPIYLYPRDCQVKK